MKVRETKGGVVVDEPAGLCRMKSEPITRPYDKLMKGPGSFTIHRVPSPKNKDLVVEEVARDFEAFFIREFLKNSLQMSGELSEKYGYFYKEIVVDTLARNMTFEIKDILKRAIENQLEAMQSGYIRKKKLGTF